MPQIAAVATAIMATIQQTSQKRRADGVSDDAVCKKAQLVEKFSCTGKWMLCGRGSGRSALGTSVTPQFVMSANQL